MPYLRARHTKRLLLVPVGVLFIISPVYSEDSGSVSDGLCNYCAAHASGNFIAARISTSYKPLLGFAKRKTTDRNGSAAMRVARKKMQIAIERGSDDGLCNYCGDYISRDVASIRLETSYIPLAGYSLEASSPRSPNPSKYAGH